MQGLGQAAHWSAPALPSSKAREPQGHPVGILGADASKKAPAQCPAIAHWPPPGCPSLSIQDEPMLPPRRRQEPAPALPSLQCCSGISASQDQGEERD